MATNGQLHLAYQVQQLLELEFQKHTLKWNHLPFPLENNGMNLPKPPGIIIKIQTGIKGGMMTAFPFH